MPEVITADEIAEEKKVLAIKIANAYVRLTGQQLLEVAVAAKCSPKTLERYCKEVKKLPVGEKILEEMELRISGSK